MVQKINFSADDLKILAHVLGELKMTCRPSFKQIQPIVQIKPAEQEFGAENGIYTLDELNNLSQTNQFLPAHIDAIKMNGTSWFYSDDEPFDFYSTKARVILSFAPQRMLDPKILKNKSIYHHIQKMLATLSLQGNLSEQEVLQFFPENICRKIYELDPPREHILNTLMSSIEQVRRVLFLHLLAHHTNDIQQLPEFQKFQQNTVNSPNLLKQFLKKDYMGFILAERWGYISNAKQLISYQQLRDVPRHPSKLMPDPILAPDFDPAALSDNDQNRWLYHMGYPLQNPTQLYQDFKNALSFVAPQKNKNVVSYDDAMSAIWSYQSIEQFKQILAAYPREKKLETFLTKHFPTEISTDNVIIEHPNNTQSPEQVTHFDSFYIRGKGVASDKSAKKQTDGSLLLKESEFHDWLTHSNTNAHANSGYQGSAKILSQDLHLLMAFVDTLQEAHDRKRGVSLNGFIRQKKQTVQN